MDKSLRFLGTFLVPTLFVLSISVGANAQNPKSALAQQLASPAAAAPEYSTWLLLAAGVVGVVVARKRAYRIAAQYIDRQIRGGLITNNVLELSRISLPLQHLSRPA